MPRHEDLEFLQRDAGNLFEKFLPSKIICTVESNCLTIGKEYKPSVSMLDKYGIVNDKGEFDYYPMSNFTKAV